MSNLDKLSCGTLHHIATVDGTVVDENFITIEIYDVFDSLIMNQLLDISKFKMADLI